MTNTNSYDKSYYTTCEQEEANGTCQNEATYQIRYLDRRPAKDLCVIHRNDHLASGEATLTNCFRRPNNRFYNPLEGDKPKNWY